MPSVSLKEEIIMTLEIAWIIYGRLFLSFFYFS